MSSFSSGAPYGNKQPDMNQNIKQFTNTTSSIAAWVYKKYMNMIYIVPASNKSVLIPKDLIVLGNIIVEGNIINKDSQDQPNYSELITNMQKEIDELKQLVNSFLV
jgi:hypothetical protein